MSANGGVKQASSKTYVILKNLGEGSFGKVKEALHVLTQEKIAVKVLEKDRITSDDDKLRVRREIEILKTVRHPNIVQLYEVIETEKYHFMVMEYVENGELADYIEQREKVANRYAAQRARVGPAVSPARVGRRLPPLDLGLAPRYQAVQHPHGRPARPKAHRLRPRQQLRQRQRFKNELRLALFRSA